MQSVRLTGFLHCVNQPHELLGCVGDGNIVMLKGHRVRNLLFTKIDTYEFTESVDVINAIFCALVGQVELYLE